MHMLAHTVECSYLTMQLQRINVRKTSCWNLRSYFMAAISWIKMQNKLKLEYEHFNSEKLGANVSHPTQIIVIL